MSNPGKTPYNYDEPHIIYNWSIHLSVHPSLCPFDAFHSVTCWFAALVVALVCKAKTACSCTPDVWFQREVCGEAFFLPGLSSTVCIFMPSRFSFFYERCHLLFFPCSRGKVKKEWPSWFYFNSVRLSTTSFIKFFTKLQGHQHGWESWQAGAQGATVTMAMHDELWG